MRKGRLGTFCVATRSSNKLWNIREIWTLPKDVLLLLRLNMSSRASLRWIKAFMTDTSLTSLLNVPIDQNLEIEKLKYKFLVFVFIRNVLLSQEIPIRKEHSFFQSISRVGKKPTNIWFSIQRAYLFIDFSCLQHSHDTTYLKHVCSNGFTSSATQKVFSVLAVTLKAKRISSSSVKVEL